MTLKVHVDAFDHRQLVGWAFDNEHPERRIALEIWVGGHFQAVTFARQFRLDLSQADIGDGCHGFTYPLPAHLSAQPRLDLELRVFPTGEHVSYHSATASRWRRR